MPSELSNRLVRLSAGQYSNTALTRINSQLSFYAQLAGRPLHEWADEEDRKARPDTAGVGTSVTGPGSVAAPPPADVIPDCLILPGEDKLSGAELTASRAELEMVTALGSRAAKELAQT